MAHYAVIAIGADRPGIVAALTGTLFELGANLEDVASSILRGHFAIMLVADVPEEVPASRLEALLLRAAEPLGVSITVRNVEAAAPARARATHAIVAYAADRPGIVARLTRLLAERRVNVSDLTCRLTGEEPAVYVMVAEVAVPEGLDAGRLTEDVESIAGDLGVDVTVRPIEAETL